MPQPDEGGCICLPLPEPQTETCPLYIEHIEDALESSELEAGRLRQNVASFTQAAFNQKERAEAAEAKEDELADRAVELAAKWATAEEKIKLLQQALKEELIFSDGDLHETNCKVVRWGVERGGKHCRCQEVRDLLIDTKEAE